MTPTDARQALEGALVAAGLRVYTASGQVSPPCVLILPGDPWLAPSQLGGRYRTFGQRIVGIVGTSSSKSQQADSEAMAQALADAIHNSPSWTLLTIGPPITYEVGGANYVAVIASTSMVGSGG